MRLGQGVGGGGSTEPHIIGLDAILSMSLALIGLHWNVALDWAHKRSPKLETHAVQFIGEPLAGKLANQCYSLFNYVKSLCRGRGPKIDAYQCQLFDCVLPARLRADSWRMPTFKRIVLGLAVVLLLGALGFSALAWRSAIAPINPPSGSSFDPNLIAKGEVLAGAGYCAVCHTRPGGQPLSGGYALRTPFGTVYSTNITPDPDTGLGRWSLAAFTRAMHEGVSRDGSHLFPAFPYDHFTKVSDEDVKALYAYVMTRQPVKAPAQANTIPFPLNIRVLQEGWKILFFRSGRYQPNPAKTTEWNRGAYLAEGLSHCGGCHTPRNLLGAEEVRRTYAGAVIDDWIAPALTDANPAPVPWTESELFGYLRGGITALHGVSAGPMSPVVHTGLALVPDADIRAVAIYFADLDHSIDRTAAVAATVGKALSTSGLGSGQEYDPDARLYAAACMGCHYNAGPTPLPERPELALNSALTLPDPTNLIQVMLRGIGITEGGPGLTMPAYAGLSDDDIARLGTYLRRTRTDRPPWADMENHVAAIRKQMSPAMTREGP
jgi:mono/diheme cytochrome c family protein